MRTNVSELGDSRVRIDVAVESADVERALERAAGEMAKEMRLPGFRKGKVPPQLAVQRLGRDAVFEQALRAELPGWYEGALLSAGVNPIGEPQLSVERIPDPGEDLSFAVEVSVRPKAKLGEWKGVEAGKPEPEVPEGAVEAELDRLREAFASLNPVDRPAEEGDLVVIDHSGTVDGESFEGSEGSDVTVEIGGEGLMPELDRALRGRSAGEELEVEVDFPADHQVEQLAGRHATFAVTVKEVREKELPPPDDDFAAEASEFDTLSELRAEIERRITEALEERAQGQFRENAVDAVVAVSEVRLSDELISARAEEAWSRAERQLAAQGMNPQAYLQMQGKTREQMVEEATEEAERSLRREAVLEAIAEAEGVEVSREELLEALESAESKESPEEVLQRLEASGRDTLLREEIRMRKAADVVAERAKPIPMATAEAREKLWTPEKERAEPGESELWTPGG